MPGTNAAFSRVEIDAQLKNRAWDALQKTEAGFHSLLARTFRGDQAVEHSLEKTAVV